MGLRMIAPKRVKKVKSANSQEVLDRLQQYLDGDFDEPVEILCGFWQDQQDAISYQELRQAVRDGMIDDDTINLWRKDYSVLVAGRFNHIWSDAIKAGAAGQPLLDGLLFTFGIKTREYNWIKNRGAQFVTDCTEEQQSAIAALLTKKMRDGHTVDELARMIRPCIGLTEQDAKAVMRYYDSIVEAYRKDHPRMKLESIRKRARDAAQKYAERKHRQRALTIAQTESAFAYNRGAYEGIRQAQEQNLIGTVKKRWNTSGDDSVCDTCAALDGVEIDMDEEFGFKGRVLFAGQKLLPPAHPRCGCAVEYIEVNPVNGTSGRRSARLGAGNDDVDDVQQLEYIGSIDPDKSKEAMEYFGNTIRDDDVENAIVIDRYGGVYHAKGNMSAVRFDGADLNGACVIHNHPEINGIVSLSEDDFMFMKENHRIAELQAVNRHYTYSAVPLEKIKEISYNEIYREALIRGYETSERDLQHLAMEVLAEKGGALYVRTPFE